MLFLFVKSFILIAPLPGVLFKVDCTGLSKPTLPLEQSCKMEVVGKQFECPRYKRKGMIQTWDGRVNSEQGKAGDTEGSVCSMWEERDWVRKVEVFAE